MALIDDFRRSPVGNYRGGYLFVILCILGYVLLSIFFPPGPGLTSWTELFHRLLLGIPALLLCLLPSFDPVFQYLRENWDEKRSPFFFLLAALGLIIFFHLLIGPWPSPWKILLACLFLYLPFPVFSWIKKRSSIAAGWLGMLGYIVFLAWPPLKMVLIRPQGDLRLDLDLWFLLCLSACILLFEHQLKFPIRYSWKMRGSDGLWVLAGGIALFFLVVLPAQVIGFSDLLLRRRSLLGISIALFAKTYLVAFSQEYLFRGVVFESLPKEGKWWKGIRGTILVLLLSSLWFGITHYLIGGWNYVILASLAGLVYGAIYMKTARLAPAMVLHGLLDTAKYLFYG